MCKTIILIIYILLLGFKNEIIIMKQISLKVHKYSYHFIIMEVNSILKRYISLLL